MKTFSALLSICEGNLPVMVGSLHGAPAMHDFDVFPSKLLSIQSTFRWFETPWRPCDVIGMEFDMNKDILQHHWAWQFCWKKCNFYLIPEGLASIIATYLGIKQMILIALRICKWLSLTANLNTNSWGIVWKLAWRYVAKLLFCDE